MVGMDIQRSDEAVFRDRGGMGLSAPDGAPVLVHLSVLCAGERSMATFPTSKMPWSLTTWVWILPLPFKWLYSHEQYRTLHTCNMAMLLGRQKLVGKLKGVNSSKAHTKYVPSILLKVHLVLAIGIIVIGYFYWYWYYIWKTLLHLPS